MKTVPPEPKQGGFRGRPGDPSKAQRCGAKTRRGTPCQRAAERNPQTGRRTRCRLHGGLSTGARTPEGKARQLAATFRHGRYSKAFKEARRLMCKRLETLKDRTKGLNP